jgi:hypothetical protein
MIQEFVNVILDVLLPMPNVTAVQNRGHIVLYKDGVIFGKILAQSVWFLSDRNKFIKMETELIARIFKPKNQLNQSDLDTFLFEANKAWWLAKGKL